MAVPPCVQHFSLFQQSQCRRRWLTFGRDKNVSSIPTPQLDSLTHASLVAVLLSRIDVSKASVKSAKNLLDKIPAIAPRTY
jgi:hypothetical protein